MPLRLEVAIFSRTRSPITWRSNWAKDSSTLSVSRLIKRHPKLIEQLDQLGEVGERAGEPVNFVGHHGIDLAGPDLGQQGLQGRALERSPRNAAIVVVVGNKPPALMGLALDVSLAGLALGIE